MFEMYRLPEEHSAVREAVREVCDAKVAPNAAAHGGRASLEGAGVRVWLPSQGRLIRASDHAVP